MQTLFRNTLEVKNAVSHFDDILDVGWNQNFVDFSLQCESGKSYRNVADGRHTFGPSAARWDRSDWPET